MVNNVPKPPTPINEPVQGYLPNSPERIALKAELKRQESTVIEIPCIISIVLSAVSAIFRVALLAVKLPHVEDLGQVVPTQYE